jgi:tRNA U34 2-thiouridine synthase MnmA/TrmU
MKTSIKKFILLYSIKTLLILSAIFISLTLFSQEDCDTLFIRTRYIQFISNKSIDISKSDLIQVEVDCKLTEEHYRENQYLISYDKGIVLCLDIISKHKTYIPKRMPLMKLNIIYE